MNVIMRSAGTDMSVQTVFASTASLAIKTAVFFVGAMRNLDRSFTADPDFHGCSAKVPCAYKTARPPSAQSPACKPKNHLFVVGAFIILYRGL